MNKEIYERIADTYLGKRNNKQHRAKAKKRKWVIAFALTCSLVLVTVVFLSSSAFFSRQNTGASIYVLSERYPLRLVYDLNPPQLGIKKFSYALPKIDAKSARYLSLRIKGAKFSGFTNILRIEIENIRHEKDTYYIRDITNKWQDFSIELSNFAKITEWSKITGLSFIFEDWNVSSKNGIIYVDNIRFNE